MQGRWAQAVYSLEAARGILKAKAYLSAVEIRPDEQNLLPKIPSSFFVVVCLFCGLFGVFFNSL